MTIRNLFFFALLVVSWKPTIGTYHNCSKHGHITQYRKLQFVVGTISRCVKFEAICLDKKSKGRPTISSSAGLLSTT
ncbi:hypothetical protein F4819DRAFT_445629 [Hypoxylon fuscum]|nr:hypothetical protein F4819DRAFT_445629 [Hypoxylon fuscum]